MADLWKAYCQFPYLPRLASFEVLAGAISDGVSKLDWVAETFSYAEGHDGTRWVGLVSAQHVSARPGGFVVASTPALTQIKSDEAARKAVSDKSEDGSSGGDSSRDYSEVTGTGADTGRDSGGDATRSVVAKTSFYGQFSLDNVRAIRQLEDILQNVVEHLNAAPGSAVTVTVEINATSDGYDERIRRVVSENATQLGVKSQEFE